MRRIGSRAERRVGHDRMGEVIAAERIDDGWGEVRFLRWEEVRSLGSEEEPGGPSNGGGSSVQVDVYEEVVAVAVTVVAAVCLGYARASARAGRDAVAAARRTLELAEVSRQAAERARLRQRVERIGQLVQEIWVSSQDESSVNGRSPATRARCNLLGQAMVGLKDLLPRSGEVCSATSPDELRNRAEKARVEIDRVLTRITGRRVGARRVVMGTSSRAHRPSRALPRGNG